MASQVSWGGDDSDLLAYGVFVRPGEAPRVGMRFNGDVIDLASFAATGRLAAIPDAEEVFRSPRLNEFMAVGPTAWSECLDAVQSAIDANDSDLSNSLVRQAEVDLQLPFEVRDFVDFYASKHHAAAAGALMRPGWEIPSHWPYVPLGYHSRAGSVVVAGDPLRRPCGQVRPGGVSDSPPVYAETQMLDFELELGFVIGTPSDGEPVPLGEALRHVFGVVLLNDWSARDIQSLESQPLGPFLGKAFATSIAPWVVPIDLLMDRRVPVTDQDPLPLPHLHDGSAANVFDISLTAALKTPEMSEPQVFCRTNAHNLYWSVEQQIAHLTSSGASLRTGDLLGTGTISGPEADSRACLFELTANGTDPLQLANGTTRTFLEDGDEVVLSGTGLGSMHSRILPANSPVLDGVRA